MDDNVPLNSITMTVQTLEMLARTKGGPIGLDEVLRVLKNALDEKKPVFVEDESTGDKYRLIEGSELAWVKE